MALKGQAKVDYMREWMRKRRLDPVFRAEENERAKLGARRKRREQGKDERGKKKKNGVCKVCGFSETTDIHHEGKDREMYILCPNHHALITRGIKTLEDMLINNEEVRPSNKDEARRKLAEQGLTVGKDGMLDALKSKSNPLKEETSSRIPPRYNPEVHKPGDLVLKFVDGKWIEVTVPEQDAEGSSIPEYW